MIGHWREYAAEAVALGLFMVAATVCTVALEHPASPLRAALPEAFGRRLVMGLAMGATAAAIIYSPLGARSGAHMNPAVTLAFLWLGRMPAATSPDKPSAEWPGRRWRRPWSRRWPPRPK
jgi:aquaporin Z